MLNHTHLSILLTVFTVIRASKLSTQLRTRSTGPSVKLACLKTGYVDDLHSECYHPLYAVNKKLEVVDCCNIHVVNFKLDIRID